MRLLVLIVILTSTRVLFAQNNNHDSIIINYGGFCSYENNIIINNSGKNIKIVRSQYIGFDESLLCKKNKKEFKKLQKNFVKTESKKEKKAILDRINELYKLGSVYKKDSTQFIASTNLSYVRLFHSISVRDKLLLERNYDDKRIILDGTHFKIDVIKNNTLDKSVFVHAPSEKSHPLIYKFYRSTMDILNYERDKFKKSTNKI